MKAGTRVLVIGKHPYATHAGQLVAFEAYGPAVFNWKGWRVRLDGNWGECYCSPENVQVL
jgi:hypothetical protein